MTLILAVTTPEIVVLCADRRITTQSFGKLGSQFDSDGKSFIFGGPSLAGFSGLATLGGLRMEMWLSRELVGQPDDRVPHVLAEKLTEARRKAPRPQDVTIAFLGVGFRFVGGKPTPQAWLVSNALDDDEEYSPDWVDTEFKVVWKPSEYGKVKIRHIGEPVDAVALRMAEDAIAQNVVQAPTDPRTIFDNLEALNAMVAHASDGRVGTAISLSALRRSTFLTGAMGFTTLGSNWATQPGVIYDYRGRGVQSDDPGRLHFPAVINSKINVVGGFFSMNGDPTQVPTDRYPQVSPPSKDDH